MPYVLFLIVCTVWGASFILMKKAGLALGPVSIGAWRVASGAAVLAILWWFCTNRPKVSWRQLPHVVVVGLVGCTWPYSIQPYLVVKYGSGFIGMFVAFVPVLTILVSVPMLGVYPTRRQLIGVIGGLVCLVIIMADGSARSVPPVGLLMAFTVPLGYAIGNTYIKLKLPGVDPLPLTIVALTISSAILLPLSTADGLLEPLDLASPTGPLVQDNWTLAITSLLVLGVLGTGMAMFIFNRLILDHGPLFAGMVTYLVPLGAVFWGRLDDEVITPLQLAALAGVLAMVALVQYGAAKTPDQPAP